jgi:HprK-related kinase A
VNPIVDVGPYRFCVENCPDFIMPILDTLYDDSINLNPTEPVDFYLTIKNTSIIRRFIKRQVCIYIDNQRPFNPISPSLLMPSLEWGMNWCIASYDYSHLLIHSSVLVKNNKAIIFPATPGSGKSTLAAYFSMKGWEVFSDEMAIIDLDSNTVIPMHRPASLKNNSIKIIENSGGKSLMSPTTYGTHKGDIAHLKLNSRRSFNGFSKATFVAAVFPKFKYGEELVIENISQLEGFAKLAHHSFNYSILGEVGFSTLKKVVSNSMFYKASYSSYTGLDDFLEELVS